MYLNADSAFDVFWMGSRLTLDTEPPPRKGGGKVEDVDGMIAKLKELGAI